MNKKFYTAILLIALSTILVIACKKQKNENGLNSLSSDNEQTRTLVSPANLSTMAEVRSNLKRLAISVAVFGQKSQATIGPISFYRGTVEGLLDNGNEVTILDLYDYWINNQSIKGFVQPTVNGDNDYYAATSYQISTYPMTGSTIGSWNPSFFQGFTLNGVGYYTFISIPDFDEKKPLVGSNQLIVFADDRDVGTYPKYAYKFDQISGTVTELTYNTEKDIEDAMAANQEYFWVVSYDKVDESDLSESNCETGFICGDFYCDEHCGEALPCPDCSPAGNKTVYLEKIRINKDVRHRDMQGFEGKHYESALNAKYEVGYSAFVKHANGKFFLRNRVLLDKIKSKFVERERKYGNLHETSKGNSQWIGARERNKSYEPVISKNFNVNTDEIYIVLYENDPMKGKTTINIGTGQDLETRSNQLAFCSEKAHPTVTHIKIVPSDWQADPANPGEFFIEYKGKTSTGYSPTFIDNEISFFLRCKN